MKSRKKGKLSPIKSKFLGALFLVSVASAILLFSSASFVDEEQLVEAPANPEFLKYLDMKEKGLWWPTHTPDGYPLGDIPEPFLLDYTYDLENLPSIEVDKLPKSWDARTKTKNRLTKIKDQGNCGSCWACAGIACVEAGMGKPPRLTSPGFIFPIDQKNKTDYSEMHLARYHGFANGECDGGNLTMVVANFTRRCNNPGPINENLLPYEYAQYTDQKTYKVARHVQNIVYIPKRTDSSDPRIAQYTITKIKQAVMRYGCVYVNM